MKTEGRLTLFPRVSNFLMTHIQSIPSSKKTARLKKISNLMIMSGFKTKFSKIFFKARYFYQSGESSFHIAEVMG